MKKLLTFNLMCLSLLALSACQNAQTPIPEKNSTSTTSLSSTSESLVASQATSSSSVTSTTSSSSSSQTQELAAFIGDWELNITGEEGWFLTIDIDKFQFYPLYNGHVDAPNLENVSYELSEDGVSLTLIGDRLSGNSIRGEDLGNDKARDTLTVTLVETQLSVTYDGKTASLSDGSNLFTKISDTPTIVPWPYN